MSHVVMIARALLDPKTFDQVLTEDRLAELGTNRRWDVRSWVSKTGWLADSVDSAGEYVDVPRTRETSYRHDAVTCT